MTYIPHNQHVMAFQISFSSQQPSSVQGTRLQSGLPLDLGEWLVSTFASKPTLGDTFMVRLNTELTHPIWVFPLCFDGIFFFMRKQNRSILNLYSGDTFSWLCQPMFAIGGFSKLLRISSPFCLN